MGFFCVLLLLFLVGRLVSVENVSWPCPPVCSNEVLLSVIACNSLILAAFAGVELWRYTRTHMHMHMHTHSPLGHLWQSPGSSWQDCIGTKISYCALESHQVLRETQRFLPAGSHTAPRGQMMEPSLMACRTSSLFPSILLTPTPPTPQTHSLP